MFNYLPANWFFPSSNVKFLVVKKRIFILCPMGILCNFDVLNSVVQCTAVFFNPRQITFIHIFYKCLSVSHHFAFKMWRVWKIFWIVHVINCFTKCYSCVVGTTSRSPYAETASAPTHARSRYALTAWWSAVAVSTWWRCVKVTISNQQ